MFQRFARVLLLLWCLTRVTAETSLPAAEASDGVLLVSSVMPPDVAPGAPHRLRVRGGFPPGPLSVRLTGLDAPVSGRVVEVVRPPGAAEGQAGGGTATELEVEVTLPAETPPGTNVALVVATSRGDSGPHPLFVAPVGRVAVENEPNDQFENAPSYPEGQMVRGTLNPGGDEDVFRVTMRAGQTLRAEVWSARVGVPLDAALGLHDRRGMALMVIEDGDGTGPDPVLEFQSSSDGPVLLVVRRQEGSSPARAASAYLLDVVLTP